MSPIICNITAAHPFHFCVEGAVTQELVGPLVTIWKHFPAFDILSSAAAHRRARSSHKNTLLKSIYDRRARQTTVYMLGTASLSQRVFDWNSADARQQVRVCMHACMCVYVRADGRAFVRTSKRACVRACRWKTAFVRSSVSLPDYPCLIARQPAEPDKPRPSVRSQFRPFSPGVRLDRPLYARLSTRPPASSISLSSSACRIRTSVHRPARISHRTFAFLHAGMRIPSADSYALFSRFPGRPSPRTSAHISCLPFCPQHPDLLSECIPLARLPACKPACSASPACSFADIHPACPPVYISAPPPARHACPRTHSPVLSPTLPARDCFSKRCSDAGRAPLNDRRWAAMRQD